MSDREIKQEQTPEYEARDPKMGRIVLIGLGSVVILVVAIYILNEFFIISKNKLVEDVTLTPVSIPLRELRSHEEEVLNSYKILDSQQGIYQIPIERAMEIISNHAYQERGEKSKSEGNLKGL
jgi:hypothetical protein